MQDEIDAGMTTVVEASYDNHDEWISPIGVEDDPNWPTIYSA